MTVVNKVKNKSRPGTVVTKRLTYSNTGALLGTYGPITTVTGSNTFPCKPFCYGRNYAHRRDYYTDSSWRSALAANGYLPTRSLTHQVLAIEGENWSGVYRHPARWYERIELSGGYFNVPTSLLGFEDYSNVILPECNSLIADAQYNALSKARDMRINAAVTFAEGRKTVNMLLQTARQLATAYRHFRKGRFRKAARTLGIDKPSKAAANHWLAYQYGWRPLVSDAVGAATTLHDYLERERPPRTTVRGFAVGKILRSEKTFGSHPQIVGYTQKLAFERQFVARAGLLLEVQNSISKAAAQLGVGLYDPLNTAWELVPFSFVFDWFVDIGGWLEARSSLQGWRVLTGWASRKCDYSFNISEVPGGTYSKPDNLASWNGRFSDYYRFGWTGSVVQLRAPLLDGLNARRLTTAASLFVQQLGGDRRPGNYRP